MRANNQKLELHNEVTAQVEAFLSQGRVIDVVPINCYKREDVTLRDKAAILGVNRNSVKGSKKKSGEVMREIEQQLWKQRQLRGEL